MRGTAFGTQETLESPNRFYYSPMGITWIRDVRHVLTSYRLMQSRYDPEMGNVIPEREMKRRRLIVKIDRYIYSAVAAGLITADEVPHLKVKVRANNRWERRKQPR